MKKNYRFILFSLCFGASLSFAHAETVEEKGLSIIQEAERRDQGWHDMVSTLTMELYNKHGEKRERILTSKALEVPNDGNKRLAVFEFPPDVRGTGLLTFSHKNGDDDQWLYIPSLMKVKRIAVSNRSGSFMGSEFSYEDISDDVVEKHNYRWLRDEECDEGECFVVESTPLDLKNSGFSRRIIWMDKRHYFVHKTEYFDHKEKHYKTLFIRKYQRYMEKYWRPAEMEMVNHETERKTIIRWKNIDFSTGLGVEDFSKRVLKR